MITIACAPCSWLPCWRGQLIVHCTVLRELREWFFNYFVVRQILQFVSQTVERCFHLPIMLLNIFMDFYHLFVNLLHIFVNFFVNIFYILIQLFQKVGCRTIVVAAVIWSWEFYSDYYHTISLGSSYVSTLHFFNNDPPWTPSECDPHLFLFLIPGHFHLFLLYRDIFICLCYDLFRPKSLPVFGSFGVSDTVKYLPPIPWPWPTTHLKWF